MNSNYAKSQTPTFEDAHRQATYSRFAHRCDDRALPAVPRAEGTSSHLPSLRLLQATTGSTRRRGVGRTPAARDRAQHRACRPRYMAGHQAKALFSIGRNGGGAPRRRAQGDLLQSGRISAVGPGISAISPEGRLFGVWWRATRRRRRVGDRGPWSFVGQGGAQRDYHGLSLRRERVRRAGRGRDWCRRGVQAIVSCHHLSSCLRRREHVC